MLKKVNIINNIAKQNNEKYPENKLIQMPKGNSRTFFMFKIFELFFSNFILYAKTQASKIQANSCNMYDFISNVFEMLPVFKKQTSKIKGI